VASAADLAFLRQVPLFRDIPEDDLASLFVHLRPRRLRRGEVLLREGDAGTEMYFIRSGQFVVSKHVRGRVDQVLAHMAPGDFAGEMSLFDSLPRSATIQAETDGEVYSIDAESLDRFIEQSPRAAAAFFFQLVQVFIKRLRDSSQLVAEVTRWGLEATGLDVDA
jgi:CRP/FNR family cyclic AMP-dependent transcriptional regulator